MTDDEPNPDPERLLAQVEWVRALARRLVRDSEHAEDLAQTALLAALRRSPVGMDSPGRLRAWFARVLANGAREERRGAVHRRAREERAARRAVQPSTMEVVERAATHRAVVDAVLELQEPYRATILLRYFDGLSVASCAQRMGVSQVAVRKRVSRAVGILRVRLEPDDPRGWFLALGRLADGNADSTIPPTPLIGVALSSKLVIAGAAALIAIVAFFVWRPPTEELVSHSITSARERRSDVDLPVRTASLIGRGARVGLGRAAASPGADLVVIAEGTKTGLVGAELHVVARATREELVERLAGEWSALGIEGQVARWFTLAGAQALPADFGGSELPPFVPRLLALAGTTDAEGRVSLSAVRAALGDALGVVVTHSEHVSVFVPSEWLARGDGEERQLALPFKCALNVQLVDATTGAGVAGGFVRVELESGMSPGAPRPLFDPLRWYGPTHDTGRLELEGLPVGAKMWLTPLGDFSSRPTGFHIDVGLTERELQVWSVGGLRGRIVRADGTPVPGAAIGWRGPWALVAPNLGAFFSSDERGEFDIAVAVAGCGRLSVVQGMTPLVTAKVEVRPGTIVDIGDLVVPDAIEYSGRLLLPNEAQSGQFGFELWTEGIRRAQGGVALDGRFACRVERGTYELVISLHEDWHRREVLRRRVDAPNADMEFDLRPLLGSLRASLPPGFPDMGAVGRLIGGSDLGARGRAERTAMTRRVRVVNEQLELGLLPPGVFDLELGFGDLGTVRHARVHIESAIVTDLGELDLAGGVLEGIVTDAAGEAVAGAHVQLAAVPLTIGGDGPASRRDTRTGADGRYRLSVLDAREWRAWAQHPELGTSAVRMVAVSNDAEATCDFDLAAPCFVRGRVTRRSEPARDVDMSWDLGWAGDVLVGQLPARGVRPSEDGTYELGPFVPGKYRVIVRSGAMHLARSVTLVPGESAQVDFELEQELRRVQIVSDGEPLAHIEHVKSFCVDERSPHFGATSTGILRGVGLVELALPPARVALRLRLGRFEEGSYVYLFLDGAELGAQARATLPDGVLELALPPDRRGGQRPELHVLGLPDSMLPEMQVRGIRHPAQHESDLVRFPCLTPGTRCLIIGPGADGLPRECVVTYVGPGIQRVNWE